MRQLHILGKPRPLCSQFHVIKADLDAVSSSASWRRA